MYVFKLTQAECNVLIKSLKESLKTENGKFATHVMNEVITKFEAVNYFGVRKVEDYYAIIFKAEVVTRFDVKKHARIAYKFKTAKEARDFIAKNAMAIMYNISEV